MNKSLNQQLENAIRIAAEAHAHQTDKYGQPYITHVLRVGMAGKNLEEKIVGVLHDLLEDTPWTADDLRNEGFAENLIEAILTLTKPHGADYMEYVAKAAANPLAKAVKMNDLQDNLNLKRVDQVTEKDIPRINKYLKAWRYLSGDQ
ncbi:MAG: phosphohydrolase [Bacteroidia bacterium]|nr:phosphohydrolase [Bacteroidia bacterium]